MNLLTVSELHKKIGADFRLEEISFQQPILQKIAIAGETGSGKSTLLKIIAGLIQPDAGTVFLEGERVKGPDEELVPGHPRIAYLSQHFELRNNYRVEEILEYANRLSATAAAKIYSVCRIAHLLKRKTDQLSGGEKQRIALARLLTTSPKLLLLDEPFSNLDMIHKLLLKSVIRDVGEQLGISCIMVSHDPLDTLSWADEIFVLKNGRIIQQGKPEQLFFAPVDIYTAGLFGAYNLLSAEQAKLFPELKEQVVEGKRIFMRPEQFVVSKELISSAKGIVSHIAFMGSYYQLEIMMAGEKIITHTERPHFQKGDTVFLSLQK